MSQPRESRKLRLTLELTVSELSADRKHEAVQELLESGLSKPEAVIEGLEDLDAAEVAEAVADAVIDNDEMWAGSNLYAEITAATVVQSEFVS